MTSVIVAQTGLETNTDFCGADLSLWRDDRLFYRLSGTVKMNKRP
jgi:hypothetical protein